MSDQNPEHWDEAVRLVMEKDALIGSSLLQRKLQIGYTKAMRLLDEMERRGLISGYNGARPRRLLVGPEDIIETNPPRP